MDKTFKIRPLTPEDWESFRTIRLQSLRECPGVYLSSHEAESTMTPEEWQGLLDGNGKCIFGLFQHATLNGIGAVFTSREDESGKTAVLAMWFIRNSARGLGLSQNLFQAGVDWAKAQPQFSRIIVSHRAGNEGSRKANRKLGFRPTGQRLTDWPDGAREYRFSYELRIR